MGASGSSGAPPEEAGAVGTPPGGPDVGSEAWGQGGGFRRCGGWAGRGGAARPVSARFRAVIRSGRSVGFVSQLKDEGE